LPTNQKTTITAIVLATILAASIIVMALPFESAKAGRGGDADIRQRGGDARTGDFESDGSGNEGNSQKVVMLLVAQQAATIHQQITQSNRNTRLL
jgi:hypothetical protein